MKDKTCCFTGHRNIPNEDKVLIMMKTEEKVRELIEAGVTRFLVGGAVGYDTLSAELLLLRIREDHPEIQVVLAYPYEGFNEGWSVEQKATYAKLFPEYDEAVCVEPKAGREAYLSRDRYMVNNSAYCIAYCTRNTGGSAYTMRYAQKHGLAVFNVADT